MSAQPASVDAPVLNRLRIALSELEPADAELFRACLERVEERLSHHWEWADLARADLVIVDMDSLFGHMAWLKAHGTGKQVISFAKIGAVNGSDLVLAKPLDDRAFAAVLEQAAARIDASEGARRTHAPVRTAEPPTQAPRRSVSAEFPVVPAQAVSVMDLAAAGDVAAALPQPPQQAESTEPEPEPRNVAEMLCQQRIDHAVRVEGTGLVIDPARDAYYSDEAALKPLKAALEKDPAALQRLDEGALVEAQHKKPHPLPRLRWFAGLVATPGTLAHGLHEGEKYKLSRWPQTEREFPRHFRIATAMMKQAATPAEIAQASGVPVAEVIDYINASQAAGWLAVELDETAPAESEPSARGNVLSRFRKPFAK
ncbi:MAG TPA: hypothetical protein VJ722_00710 [Rhodanobacteraceae bacterium]|nr:hypothetical protein [Rhodanobacteraceae bacterium]